ncbi:MAG: lysoplasmalogenase [Actinomycetota bacterium]|jgi:uncharacterized membrane protein YhhN|nr:lysoplasmalogenase [Actinomycetota bacterium]
MSNPWTYVDLLLLLGVALGAGGALFAYRSDRRPLYALGKTVASLSFVALALSSGFSSTSWTVFVVSALICAAFGDILLAGRAPGFFVAGFALFVSAHVLFAIGFVLRGAPGVLAAVGAAVATVAAALAWRWLAPHLEGWLRKAVPAYLVIVSAMLVTAWATAMSGSELGQSALLGIGATFLYLSDMAVARERFVIKSLANKVVGLPLYYMGQVLIALALARYALPL